MYLIMAHYLHNSNLKMVVLKGSPLKSTLFLIAIIIRPQNKITMYADNRNIFCRTNNILIIIQQIQNCINNLLLWSKTTGFTFSPDKLQFINF